MNVYDFDKTIYDGDSSVDFYVRMVFEVESDSSCMIEIVHKISKERSIPYVICGYSGLQ